MNDAVKHLAEGSKYLCEIYLTTSIVNMELNVNIGYPEQRVTNPEDVAKLEKNIERLRVVLEEAISRLY